MKTLITFMCILFSMTSFGQANSTHYKSSIRGSLTSGNTSSTSNLKAATVSIWTEGHIVESATYKHSTVATSNKKQNSGFERITINNIKLHIYPNPSTDWFNFSTNLTDINVVVRDVTGKEVFKQTNSKPISSFNWEQGIYIITVTSGHTVATGKVLKI